MASPPTANRSSWAPLMPGSLRPWFPHPDPPPAGGRGFFASCGRLALPGRAEGEVGRGRVAALLALAVPELVHEGGGHHDVVALEVGDVLQDGERILARAVRRGADRL